MPPLSESSGASQGDPLIGKVIDRYKVIAKIGEGGMGSVYRVEHLMLQKHLAMKLLRFELSQNQELVTRFQNEAIAAGRIGQENIVAVTDFGRTAEGLVYFVMEELIGESLAQAIQRQPAFSPTRTVAIAIQCCRALQAAHVAGIVHRDLKPENIVLTEREGFEDFVKILDFGISKMSELESGQASARLTRAGMIVGTPEYMSPEQASGTSVDARADIYSLGVVIYEMLSGVLPFSADSAIQILLKHQTAEVPSLARVRPGLKVPARLEQLVRRALAKRPGERPQSMNDLMEELLAVAEELPPLPARSAPSNPGVLLRGSKSTPGRPSRDLSQTVTGRSSRDMPQTVLGNRLANAEHEAAVALLRPRRRWPWVALALVLVGAGALALISGRGDSGKAEGAPPIPAAAGSALPSLPAVPPALPPEATAPVAPSAEPPSPPIPHGAAVTAPLAKPEALAPPAHPHPLAAKAHKTAKASRARPANELPHPAPAAAPPADYEKIDELKKPY